MQCKMKQKFIAAKQIVMCIGFVLFIFEAHCQSISVQFEGKEEMLQNNINPTMLLCIAATLILKFVVHGENNSKVVNSAEFPILSGADDCMAQCSDACSGSSCPSDPLFYVTRCNSLCLQNDCDASGHLVSSESSTSECLSCLEGSNPTNCQEQECQSGESCLNRNLGRCRTCIFNIYFAMMKCAGINGAKRLTNCIVGMVHNHCKPCVCWAACRFGLRNVCNCCRRGKCSQSRIDMQMQNMLAAVRQGEILKPVILK